MTAAELEREVLKVLAQRPVNAVEVATVLAEWQPLVRDALRSLRRQQLVVETPGAREIVWRLTDRGWQAAIAILHPQLELIQGGRS